MSIEIKISKRPISYKKAMKFMKKRVQEIKENKNCELLWILEHPLTFTAGVRFKENEILNKKIKIIKTNRGGKITLHNPGQKIIYLVLDLNNRNKDVRKLVKIIEKSIIDFLRLFKIASKKDKNEVGIWVKNKKIAAIGLKVSRWIAYHGCSININNNLADYFSILPCGLNNKEITSIDNEKKKLITNLDNKLVKIFIKNLKEI
tara:strand:- start:285 stop:896 length:612 start_codon:yes stop_codon:yes gene_type:complete